MLLGSNSIWARFPAPGSFRHGTERADPPLDPYPDLNQLVCINVKGAKDDASGTFTGSANALIENPADLLHWLLVTYGKNLTSSNICTSGWGSFSTARTAINSRMGDWPLMFKIRLRAAKQVFLRDYVARICDECVITLIEPFWDEKFRVIAWTASPSGDGYIYRAAADGGLVKFSWNNQHRLIIKGTWQPPTLTPPSEILNEVYINYLYDHARGQFTKVAYVDANTSLPDDGSLESDCSSSQTRFKVKRRFTLNAEFLYRQEEAAWLRSFVVARYAFPQLIIRFSSGLNAADLRLKHVIEIDSDMDNHVVYPIKGSDGSWDGQKFWVDRCVRKNDTAEGVQYAITGTSV